MDFAPDVASEKADSIKVNGLVAETRDVRPTMKMERLARMFARGRCRVSFLEMGEEESVQETGDVLSHIVGGRERETEGEDQDESKWMRSIRQTRPSELGVEMCIFLLEIKTALHGGLCNQQRKGEKKVRKFQCF